MALLAVFFIALLHVFLPNHWLPVSLLAIDFHWSKRKLFLYAAFLAVAHSLSTVLLGAIVFTMGQAVLKPALGSWVSFLLFFSLGVYYFIFGKPVQQVPHPVSTKQPFWGVFFTLWLAMFFSPCIELQGVYLDHLAKGFSMFWQISILYLGLTVVGISLMAFLGKRALLFLKTIGFWKYSHVIHGIIFLSLAVLSLVWEQ